MVHTRTPFLNIILLSNIPLASPFTRFPCIINYPLYLLGNPLFDDRGAKVYPHLSLVGDWLPTPTPYPPPPLPTAPTVHVTCFSKTTSQYQLHCLIQIHHKYFCNYTSAHRNLPVNTVYTLPEYYSFEILIQYITTYTLLLNANNICRHDDR